MTWRVVLLGLVLTPLQAFWIIHMELVRGGIWPTVLTLLFTVVFILLVIQLLNLAARRLAPKLALREQELLALYIVLAAGASLCGCDVGQTLVHIVGVPYHLATPENGWELTFHRYLPGFLHIDNPEILEGFYEGSSSLYTAEHLRYWAGPVCWWMIFIFCMLLAMLSLCAIVRRQWVECERLTFPIVQVPLAMTLAGGFWRERPLWIGFGLAAFLDIVNGLHVLVPWMPTIPCKDAFYINRLLTNKPWNGVGWWPVTFYPFAMGIGFLMPLEMNFSCWFGLLLWKAQKVIGIQLGMAPNWLQPPYSFEQLAGVWLAVLAFAGWTGRAQWVLLWRRLWQEPEGGERPETTVEPFGTRTWAALALLSSGGMIVFGARAGMTPGYAASYMLVYLAFSLALTRMRAEFGPPCHDLFGAGPDRIFVTWLGVRAIHARNLTGTAVFYWLSRESPRSHPMPHQLEALFLASAGRLSFRAVTLAVLGFGCLSGLVCFWAVLHNAYAHGSETKFAGPATWFASEGFHRLNNWLTNPPEVVPAERIAMVTAFCAALGCLWLRTRFLGFAFHPAGYAISSWWAINLLWMPLLMAWLTKKTLIRYGGGRAYRRARGFFIGLILGEFVVGSLWQIGGLLANTTTYAFWI